MPQIRCPNCGLTISMKNRKEIDLDLITHAVQSGPRTFTYLLHATKLPRKTLSLRLKELCEGGMILKREGIYMLNGTHVMENRSTAYFKRFSTMPYDKKIRAGILLALLIISTPVAAQVLASLFIASPPPAALPPVVIGNFDMILEAHDVTDLYGWQVYIAYNKDQMKVLDIKEGNFPDPVVGIWNNTDPAKDCVSLGDSLLGNVPGRSGSYKLATITFGYYIETYSEPEIMPTAEGGASTVLLSPTQNIPIVWGTTLTLTVENP